jgi:hypothetical protein
VLGEYYLARLKGLPGVMEGIKFSPAKIMEEGELDE